MITTKAIAIIKEFEHFSPTPYLCPAGVATIGYGTTMYPDGRAVSLKDSPITEKKATEYLTHYLLKTKDHLDKWASKNSVKLGVNQTAALLSFAYNCGLGPIVIKGKAINVGLLEGDNTKVVKGFLLYTKATVNGVKKTLSGLVTRRTIEAGLYERLDNF